ncbi:MAG TPA: argininosuccinate lyase [Pseudothermotoga sp.]
MRFSEIYKEIVLDSSFENWKKLVRYYMRLNKAHLLMLKKTKIVPQQICVEIAKTLKKIEVEKIEEKLPEQTEDLVFLIEKKLSEVVGIEKAGFLHTARSRNDIDTTIFRMCIRDELMEFAHQLIDVINVIVQKAKDNLETLILLYTHGQPAQVSSFTHYLLAYAFDFLDVLENLIRSIQIVNICPMGSGAITTTGFPIDRDMVSEYLGFSEPVENSYRAIATSHWITFPSSCLRILMNDLTRFTQEFIHKSSCEVGIFQFPDEVVQISSIMPQKRNPVILEHLRIRANVAYGIFDAIEKVFSNTSYQDINENGDFVLFKFMEGIRTAREAIILVKETVQWVDVDQKRVKELSLKTGATTTELADELVRRFNISFRQAHTVVSEYVRSNMRYDALNQSFEKICGMKLTLNQKQVEKILSPEHFVKVRKIAGGPGKKPALEMIKKIEKITKTLKKKVEMMNQEMTKSLERLESDFYSIEK